MTPPNTPHPTRRRRFASWAAIVTVALSGCVPASTGTSAGQDAPGSSRSGVACIRNSDADADYCDRFLADLARRTPLDPAQARAAETARQSVARALSGNVLSRCNVEHEPCDAVMAWAEQPATPDHVRSLLATVSENHPQVRLARPDDPAVADTVAFGVLVGQVCVYGYQRLQKDPDQVYAAGPLPQGTCLGP
ncbi:hypothetical protein ACWEOS_22770 [Micromonospora taraxaci]